MRRFLLLGLALAGLAACDEQPVGSSPPPPVRIEVVADVTVNDGTVYTASVEAKTQVDVSFQVSGTVESLLQVDGADGQPRDVQQGDIIEVGTVLAAVETTQYADSVTSAQASLASAQASLANAQANWDRTQVLYEQQSATATDYDDAKQQYESAVAQVSSTRAQLSSAQDDLSHTNLVAPMTGVVLEVDVSVGTLVGPQTVGVVLADTSSVKAVFGVPDVMLGSVAVGRAQAITTASMAGEVFEGIVTSVAPSADSSTRLFEVEVTIPNADGRLLVGMVASLVVADGGEAQSTPMVPVDALVRSANDPKGYAVFVVESRDSKDIAVLRDVEIGQVSGNRIAIVTGLAPGDRVVIVGTNRTVDGQPVRIVP